MSPRVKHTEEIKATLRSLRRAARYALELGLKTGTPVYIWENGEIVDLTKKKSVKKSKSQSVKKSKSRSVKKSKSKRSSR